MMLTVCSARARRSTTVVAALLLVCAAFTCLPQAAGEWRHHYSIRNAGRKIMLNACPLGHEITHASMGMGRDVGDTQLTIHAATGTRSSMV